MTKSLIKYADSYKVKAVDAARAIPFAWDGGATPPYYYLAASPISADFVLTPETASGAASPGAYDVWDNEIPASAFGGDRLRVANAALAAGSDHSAQFAPWNAEWDGFAVTAGASGGLSVSGYAEAANVAAGERVLPPWRWKWAKVAATEAADGAVEIEHPTQLASLRDGQPALEPTDRLWTHGLSVAVSVDDPYATGDYDLRVTPPAGADGGDWEAHYGLYKIQNAGADGLSRLWRHETAPYAIMWAEQRGRWEIRRLGAAGEGGEALDAVVESQYPNPADGKWLFGVTIDKTLSFPYFSRLLASKAGTGQAARQGAWENGTIEGDDAAGYTLYGSRYIRYSLSEGANVDGAWQNNIVAELDPNTGVLTIAGFNDSDANGEYALFRGMGNDRLWLRESDTGAFAYTVGWDADEGKWELRSSADGFYAPVTGTAVTLDRGAGTAATEASIAIEFDSGVYALSGAKMGTSTGNSFLYYGAASADATATEGLVAFEKQASGDHAGEWAGIYAGGTCYIAYDAESAEWRLYYESQESTTYWERSFAAGRNILIYDAIAGRNLLYNCVARTGISLDPAVSGADFAGLAENGSWLEADRGEKKFFYDPAARCWRYKDGTFESAQQFTPQTWRDGTGAVRDTEVAWGRAPAVSEPDAAFAGTYQPLGFFEMLLPPMYGLTLSGESEPRYVLHFDPADGRWHLARRLQVNGEYALAEPNAGIAARLWERTAPDGDSFQIAWNATAGAWQLRLLGTGGAADMALDAATEADTAACSPAECAWTNGELSYAVYARGNSLVVVSPLLGDPIAGTYALLDAETAGNARQWEKAFAGGSYRFEYALGGASDSASETLGSWRLTLHSTVPNGDYAVSGSGASRLWENANGCAIRWTPETAAWTLVFDDAGVERELAAADGASAPGALVWGEIAVAPLASDAPWEALVVTAGSGLPEAVGGEYAPVDLAATGLARQWRRESGLYTAEIAFDAETLQWRLECAEMGVDGNYDLLVPGAAGNARCWLHAANRAYSIEWAETPGRWEIRRLEGDSYATLYRQATASPEPPDGAWETAEGASVATPVSAPELHRFHAECPFILPAQVNYKYTIAGCPAAKADFNGDYILVDPKATGAAREWRRDLGGGEYARLYWPANLSRWVLSAPDGYGYLQAGYNGTDTSAKDAEDLSTLAWTYLHSEDGSGAFSGTIERRPYSDATTRTYYMVAGDGSGECTNSISFALTLQDAGITSLALSLEGSSGSSDYTGFYRDAADGIFYPTAMVRATYDARAAGEVRVRFGDNFAVPGVSFAVAHDQTAIAVKTGMLPAGRLGAADERFTITLTARDDAGAEAAVSASIVRISRLWRLAGVNIRPDSAGYATKVYEGTGSGRTQIPARTVLDDEFVRPWEDIFYPETHGYPRLADGTIDEAAAIRISQPTIDATGAKGPTAAELEIYDQLALTSDGTALAYDTDGRVSTSGWQTGKTYNRMESSAIGNIRYWIIEDGGYGDFSLEFEYFDLAGSTGSTPANPIAPHPGDTLVFYDAAADGCCAYDAEQKRYILRDTSKLHELFAVGGSCNDNSIAVKYSAIGGDLITLMGRGFKTASLAATSRLCLILYTDNAAQGSGFKLKAGPRHNVDWANYEMGAARGELWIHQPPGDSAAYWHSPAAVATDHQHYAAVTVIDPVAGRLAASTRAGRTIQGDFACHLGLGAAGTAAADILSPPAAWFAYNGIYPALYKFMLYNDDCVDYYDVLVCVSKTTATDYANIYSFTDATRDTGRIAANIAYNKDKGVVTLSAQPPAGRLFASYTCHTFLRLTSDGYGDLRFYDSALVPASDTAVAGLVDWTHVDLMVVNEGANALTNGVLKFIARGYITGSGNSAVVTQAVDQNRPWDVQSGTVAETVNRTGAQCAAAFDGLDAPSRAKAVELVGTGAGGVSLDTVAARGRKFLRVYWCLATDAAGGTHVTTTRGAKLWSSELSGNYFVVTS